MSRATPAPSRSDIRSIARRFLAPKHLSNVRLILYRSKSTLLGVVSRGRLLSSLHYGLLSRAFRREHAAVAAGVRRHLQVDGRGGIYLLRRNAHRIEKGLLMRPRRTPFALDFIAETVDAYLEFDIATRPEHSDELAWVRDVLSAYFSAVSGHPVTDKARDKFEAAAANSSTPERIPSRRSTAGNAVPYDDFLTMMRQRRSVRWFEQRPVPRDIVDLAITAAAQAPSACNRQPYTYRIFDDPALAREIAGFPLGTSGFRDNIPMIAVLVGDLSANFSERDRHGIYVDGSLSAMAFMLALESVGLSSCPLNWPDIERLERRLAARLGLASHERVIMLIAVGFADSDGEVAYSQRRQIEHIRSYNVTRD